MRYKLIALDLDGTLLNDRHEITPQTRETVRRAHDEGAKIVLCTGRGPMSTLPILDMLGLEGTVITHNGAATVYSEGRKLLHEFSFVPGERAEAFRYMREKGLHFDVCTPFEMYVESMSPEEKAMYAKFYVEPEVIEDVTSLPEIVKLTISSASADLITVTQRELNANNLLGGLNVIRSGDYFIDVMHEQATKGNALKHFADSLNIPSEQVLAIGNYYNDLEMIRFAGLGIAMDNSPAQVKDEADAVTASNNEDGVAAALNKYAFA